MGLIADPLGSGLVPNLSRPGGNLTGFAALVPGIYPKRLQLLKEVAPGLARVAALSEAGQNQPGLLADTQAAARTLGLDLLVLEIRTADDLQSKFEAASVAQADGLLNMGGPVTASARQRIAALAAQHRLASMFADRDYAIDGGLLAYGPNIPDLFRRSAGYVDKVLRGAHAGELPVQQPTKFDLAINLKTAQALGVTIPPGVLAQATEVLQ
jgi:putative ABC transport system substrate-binding protein